MITRISIHNYKSFHPVQPVPVALNPNQPVIFYGINGAGKSAIGEVIDRWWRPDNPLRHCRVETTGTGPFRCLVYNHEFVKRVIGEQEGMPGIFTLGEPDTQIDGQIRAVEDQVAEIEKELELLAANISTSEVQVANALTASQEKVWEAMLAHKGKVFNKLLEGCLKDKAKFHKELRAFQTDPGVALPTLSELEERLSDIKPGGVAKDSVTVDASELAVLEKSAAWSEPVQVSGGSRLARLIEKWGNSDWVSSGAAFAHDPECPFCQQELPGDFKEELGKLLGGDREAKVSVLSRSLKDYAAAVERIRGQVTTAEREPWVTEDDDFRAAWALLDAQMTSNLAAMERKLEHPSDPVAVAESNTANLNDAIKRINERISAFNARLGEPALEEARIKKEFWEVLCRDRLPHYEAYEAVSGPIEAQRALDAAAQTAAQERRRAAQQALNALKRRQTGADASVLAINRQLEAIGVTSFSIQRVDGEGVRYHLARPGVAQSTLQSLSEGEKTLISFLYFMELLRGSHDGNETVALDKTIVVIDDPISSLSANYIYDIAAMIHSTLLDGRSGLGVRQSIVLTHNLFFLHELLKLIGQGVGVDARQKCQLLRVVKDAHSQILPMAPSDLLNDYDALWLVLRDAKEGRVHSRVLPNTMRCILEHYFAFNNRQDDLDKALSEVAAADPTFRPLASFFKPLARFVSRGSHQDGVNVSVMDYGQFDTSYYIAKFRALFVAAGATPHFDARFPEARASEEAVAAQGAPGATAAPAPAAAAPRVTPPDSGATTSTPGLDPTAAPTR